MISTNSAIRSVNSARSRIWALVILQFKLDLLWSMLDAMLLAHCPVHIDGWGAYTQMSKVS